jgi:hypothetical protein
VGSNGTAHRAQHARAEPLAPTRAKEHETRALRLVEQDAQVSPVGRLRSATRHREPRRWTGGARQGIRCIPLTQAQLWLPSESARSGQTGRSIGSPEPAIR